MSARHIEVEEDPKPVLVRVVEAAQGSGGVGSDLDLERWPRPLQRTEHCLGDQRMVFDKQDGVRHGAESLDPNAVSVNVQN